MELLEQIISNKNPSDEDVVSQLVPLIEKASISFQQKSNAKGFLLSVEKGFIQTVKLLLENKANINFLGNSGNRYNFETKLQGKPIIFKEVNALIVATLKNDLRMVRLLLKHDININFESQYLVGTSIRKATACQLAYEVGKNRIFNLLISKGAIFGDNETLANIAKKYIQVEINKEFNGKLELHFDLSGETKEKIIAFRDMIESMYVNLETCKIPCNLEIEELQNDILKITFEFRDNGSEHLFMLLMKVILSNFQKQASQKVVSMQAYIDEREARVTFNDFNREDAFKDLRNLMVPTITKGTKEQLTLLSQISDSLFENLVNADTIKKNKNLIESFQTMTETGVQTEMTEEQAWQSYGAISEMQKMIASAGIETVN